MELSSFIEETLVQISNGIQQANDRLSPSRVKDDGTELPKLFLLPPGNDSEQGKGVHFNVAVTTQSVNEGKGGAKVKLAILEVNLDGHDATLERTVSRIQFSVNVGQWHG